MGFQLLGESFESFSYSIPVLLTEFGCLDKTFPTQDGYQAQRNFLQAKWLLEEPSIREVFSGGFGFEYSIEMANTKSDSPYPFTHLGGQNYGIGHFANETCDDITEPCSYVPHPSFYNLKETYDTTTSITQANKDTFVPSKNRLANSQCPSHYPPLSKFEWSPDKAENLACPRRGMPSKFVCPADYKELLIEERSKSDTSLGFIGLACLVVVYASVATTVAVVVRKKWVKFTDFSAIPDVTREGSFSDESDGLLSMKDYNSKYQALHSDSSSEDLTSQHEP